MAQIESQYEHWQGTHRDIWYRRGVMAWSGLQQCLKVKWMRRIITTCWIACLLQTAFLFLFSQLMDPEGLIYDFVVNELKLFRTVAGTFQGYAEQRPDIAIGMTYNLFFSIFSGSQSVFGLVFAGPNMVLTFIALSMAIPHLITSDLSSRAITIYSSKAITRLDYCIGKFGAVMLLMTLTWLGPVVITWLAGNLLAPNFNFFYYTFRALFHSVLFIGASMCCMGMLALGISAISKSARATTSLFLGLWLIGGMLSGIGAGSQNYWLQYSSFWFDLEIIGRSIFAVSNDLNQIAFLNTKSLSFCLRD